MGAGRSDLDHVANFELFDWNEALGRHDLGPGREADDTASLAVVGDWLLGHFGLSKGSLQILIQRNYPIAVGRCAA